jgi:hypothetical protein
MKTLISFYNEVERDLSFYEAAGDLRHLNGVIINGGTDEELHDELDTLLYDEDGEEKIEKLKSPTKDWDFYISCGFAE